MKFPLLQLFAVLSIFTMNVFSTRTISPIMTAVDNERNYNGVTQNAVMELIELTNDPGYSQLQYIILELKISSSIMNNILNNDATLPITCYSYNTDPVVIVDPITQELQVPCQKGYDYNQYQRANGFYSMIVPTPYGYTKVMLGIYIQSLVGTTYDVKIRGRFQQLPYDLCPFDCNMGSESQADCTNRTCNCPSDLIDYDCSQAAEEITTSKKSIELQPSIISYAYYRAHKDIKSLDDAKNIIIEMRIQSSDPSVNVLVSLEGVSPKKIVPTLDVNRLNQSMDPGLNSMKLSPDLQYNSQLKPIYCVLGFVVNSSTQQNSIIINLQSTEDGVNTSFIVIFFLVGVVALLFMVWIVLTIIRIKYARRNRVIDIIANQQEMLLQGQQNLRRRHQQQSQKLTMELIDQYMPTMTFEEISKKEKERGKTFIEACPVCLGEFEDTEICRQAICNHYFHKDCIEQWLKKQENCPFCRADLSKEALTGVKDPIGDQGARLSQNEQGQQQQQLPGSSQNHLSSQQAQSPNLQVPSQQQPLLQNSPQRRNPSHQPRLNRDSLHMVVAPGLSGYNNVINQGRSDLQEIPVSSQVILVDQQQRNNNNNSTRPSSQQQQQPSQSQQPINPIQSVSLFQQQQQQQPQQQIVQGNLNISQQPFVEEIGQ